MRRVRADVLMDGPLNQENGLGIEIKKGVAMHGLLYLQ